MKVFTILLIVLLFSCTTRNEKKPKVQAFCAVTKGETIQLNRDYFMNLEKIQFIFTRIDNQIYETKLINGKFKNYQINYNKKKLNYILKGFSENNSQDLDSQIVFKRKQTSFCGLITGYFLDDSDGTNFCLLSNKKLESIIVNYEKLKKTDVKDKSKIRILEKIYYKMNSLRWDYYMSNKYHYNEIRAFSKTPFEK